MKNLILISISLLLMTACSNQNFQTINTEDEFTAKAFYSFDVDVLWVVDNSYSTMEVHQNRIADKMNTFHQGLLRNNANFRIAATTMDMNNSGDQGELLGSVPVITPQTTNEVLRLQDLLKRGGDGANQERGSLAMKTALEKEVAKGTAATFLREEALLVVVFVTDDEDFSGITSAQSKTFLDNLKGENTADNQKWIVNYIGVTDLNDPQCTTYGGYSARGEEYLELANISGGVVESISKTDFGSYIDQINVRLKSVLNKYQLDSYPILDSLTVHINGVSVRQDEVNGWVYDESKNIVILNGTAKPGPNDDVEIKYEIKKLK